MTGPAPAGGAAGIPDSPDPSGEPEAPDLPPVTVSGSLRLRSPGVRFE